MAAKFMPPYTKADVYAYVKMKLKTSSKWALKAVLAIYSQQTPKEKKAHISLVENGVGFTQFDTPLLTAIARRVSMGSHTAADIRKLNRVMPKYVRQIVNLSRRTVLYARVDAYYGVVQDRTLPF